jgi:hypothetical protein
MKKILILLFFFISIEGFCQKIDKEFITGTWKVIKIQKVSNNPNFKDLIKSFKSSIFSFKSDGSFNLKTKNKTPLFSMAFDKVNESKWKIGNPNEVKVGLEKDNFSFIGIFVKVVNNETFFDLGEEAQFPLILKVEKLEEN